ncbi:MAG: BON domain-containing protein [Pirellulaceae bacterium]
MSTFSSSLADRVDNALVTNPYLTGRTLRFETDGGRVILRGNVSTWYQKQMAQEHLRRVEGVELIDNCLEVVGSAV